MWFLFLCSSESLLMIIAVKACPMAFIGNEGCGWPNLLANKAFTVLTKPLCTEGVSPFNVALPFVLTNSSYRRVWQTYVIDYSQRWVFNFRCYLFNIFYFPLKNTDAVHLALKLNNSDLKGRKLRVQRSVEKQKLQQKSLNKNVKNSGGLKHQKSTPLKNAKGSSSTSFAGEKAVPGKTTKKAKSKNMKKKLKKHTWNCYSLQMWIVLFRKK